MSEMQGYAAGDPTNTYQLMDNCYYCMVAFLSGRTADELVRSSEVMQYRGGGTESDIDYLFECAGLSSAHVEFINASLAEETMRTRAGRYGVGFFRTDGTGHAVVSYSDGNTVVWHDPQINSYDSQQIWENDGKANGYRFLIYGPY